MKSEGERVVGISSCLASFGEKQQKTKLIADAADGSRNPRPQSLCFSKLVDYLGL